MFQGDSITDCDRNRNLQGEPNCVPAMGLGYAKMIGANILSKKPSEHISIYNRGISGNQIVDLYARWKVDCLNLKPSILSILIGVNDTWQGKNEENPNGVEPDRYEKIY